jgi:hypothetical protein
LNQNLGIFIFYLFKILNKIIKFNFSLMGIGDWGLGIGDWGLGIGPNPQSPIPNPQSPIPRIHIYFAFNILFLR